MIPIYFILACIIQINVCLQIEDRDVTHLPESSFARFGYQMVVQMNDGSYYLTSQPENHVGEQKVLGHVDYSF